MNSKIIITLIASVSLWSCKVDRSPFSSVESDVVLSDASGLETVTLGNYALLKGSPNRNGFYDGWYQVGEYGGDNVSLSGSTTDNLFFFYNYQRVKNNVLSNSMWNQGYKAIVGTNKVIGRVSEGTSVETDQLLGENYFLRAYAYFSLTNVFSRPYVEGASNLGVPLKLDDDVNNLPARASVGDVYNQIIKDLLKAEQLMTLDKGHIFASKFAAEALLSRVYLYMNDNVNALKYADMVISSGQYSLLSTGDLPKYPTFDPDSNKETIFAFKHTQDSDYEDGWGSIGSMYATIDGVGWGEMYASSTYLNLINQHPEDARLGFIAPQITKSKTPVVYWVQKGVNKSGLDTYNYDFENTFTQNGKLYFTQNSTQFEVQSEAAPDRTLYYFIDANANKVYVNVGLDMEKRNGYPKFFILKISDQGGVPQLWSPIVVRLAEMYLNRAEANAKLGNVAAALADVNVIRTRAGIPSYSSVPVGMTALDVVLQERRLELAYEGQRKFDVYRNKQTLNRRYPGTHLNGSNPFFTVSPTDNASIEFIPEQQILIQPNLQQNP